MTRWCPTRSRVYALSRLSIIIYNSTFSESLHEDTNTSLIYLLLGLLREAACLDHNWALGECTACEHTVVAKVGDIDNGGLVAVLGFKIGILLLRVMKFNELLSFKEIIEN